MTTASERPAPRSSIASQFFDFVPGRAWPKFSAMTAETMPVLPATCQPGIVVTGLPTFRNSRFSKLCTPYGNLSLFVGARLTELLGSEPPPAPPPPVFRMPDFCGSAPARVESKRVAVTVEQRVRGSLPTILTLDRAMFISSG